MPNILLLLQRVHQHVHQTAHTLEKKIFSQPKIYTGGVNITLWNELSKAEQNQALLKDWYIYYKFKDDKTGKLKRMTNIKGGCNKFKTKKERLKILTQLRDALEYLLDKGLNPYLDMDLSLLPLENSSLNNTITSFTAPQLNERQALVISESKN